jgi:phage baseplate assembly protein W
MPTEPAFLGRGWAFPPTFGAGGLDVEMVAGSTEVAQSLEILFSTEPGERPMRGLFGSSLSRYIFAEIDQSMLTGVRGTIYDAILQFEPRIEIDALEVVESGDTPGLLTISLIYRLRGTNSRYNLVYPFYIREAVQGAQAGAR